MLMQMHLLDSCAGQQTPSSCRAATPGMVWQPSNLSSDWGDYRGVRSRAFTNCTGLDDAGKLTNIGSPTYPAAFEFAFLINFLLTSGRCGSCFKLPAYPIELF